MRYSGQGRSPIPIAAALIIAIVAVIALYLLFLQPR
jgi:hypothetical protein